MNIHVIRRNSLSIPRGLYTDWMGNALSDANANTLIAEGTAILTNIGNPSLSPALSAAQKLNQNIKGVAGVGNGKLYDENGNEIVVGGGAVVTLTTSRSLLESDNNANLVYAGASDIVLTVPSGLPSNFRATIIQAGAGRITFDASGATLNKSGQTLGAGTFTTINAVGANTYDFMNPTPSNGARLMLSGVPFIVFSAWTMGSNGALSGFGTLATAYPHAYVYFPANSISASNPAGWYYTQFSSATAGTVRNNQYTTGSATVPTSPTSFSGAAGAVTAQLTSIIQGPNVNVTGGLLGRNGRVIIESTIQTNNSANNKNALFAYGGNNLFTDQHTSAIVFGDVRVIGQNAGATNRQISRSSQVSQTSSAIPFISTDSSQDQILSINFQLATPAAGDFIICHYARMAYETGG